MEKQMEQRKTELELEDTRLIMEELEEIIEGSFDGISGYRRTRKRSPCKYLLCTKYWD